MCPCWWCWEIKRAKWFWIAMTKEDWDWHENCHSNCSVLRGAENVLIWSLFPGGEAAGSFLGEAVPQQDRPQEREAEMLRITSDIRSASQMINKLWKVRLPPMGCFYHFSSGSWSLVPQFSAGIICHSSVNFNIGKASLCHWEARCRAPLQRTGVKEDSLQSISF